MTRHPSRRAVAAGLFATTVPACITTAAAIETGKRLPAFPELWGRLPLPYTPAEAWSRLPDTTRAEIGEAIIAQALARYIAGDGRADHDQFISDALRDDADGAEHAILNAMDERLWGLFPELYGPDGDHPRWALDGGLAR